MVRFSLAFFLLAILANPVYASWFGPDNYEDCILENTPTAKTDLAVQLVMKTCRDKFPSKSKISKPLVNHVDVLGEYVCKTDTSNRLLSIEINERAKTLSFDSGAPIKIQRSTREALYSANVSESTFWEIKRIGANRFATHNILRTTLHGPDIKVKFLCERSL